METKRHVTLIYHPNGDMQALILNDNQKAWLLALCEEHIINEHLDIVFMEEVLDLT